MTLLGRVGEAAAWAISAVAWALSFTAQMQLAAVHGFTSWEVWAWPATTDLAGLVGMLIALDQTRRGSSTVVAWLIALAAAAVMVAANIGAAVGDPVSMLLHAWPPSIALACWFLLVHVRRAPKADMDLEMLVDMSPNEHIATDVRQLRKPRPARERVAALVRRHSADISPDMIALRLGISTRHCQPASGRGQASDRCRRVRRGGAMSDTPPDKPKDGFRLPWWPQRARGTPPQAR